MATKPRGVLKNMLKTINSIMLRKMITSAAKLLEINKPQIDALNVFPVPDGDTGTNMSLTMQSCVKELNDCKSNSMHEIAEAVSKGALKGARGNSGVILSQLLKGFCNVIKEVNEIDAKTFSKALKSGVEVAYGAVSKPKEGTMLTVAREVSAKVSEVYGKNKDFEILFPILIEEGERSLKKTPELLPVLKKAGVVDAGGMGLLIIYKGFHKVITGEEITAGAVEVEVKPADSEMEHADIFGLGDIEFGYCTEFFIINLNKRTTVADIDKLREKLNVMGDSTLVIGDLELVKVHVHTNSPGQALSYALELGELENLKIENMREQNRRLLAKYEAEKKEQGMLAVCAGKGIGDIFKDLLVDRIIEGGQTMNPSSNDIANAVKKINANHVFVFPNNKNIILAAEQAKALVEGKTIHVIPTKNIPQGFSAALCFNPEATSEENKTNMLHSLDNIIAGQITYAVRNANVDGFSLKTGDIIGLDSKKILTKGSSVQDVTIALIAAMKKKDHDIVTLYYGQDVTPEDAEIIHNKVIAEFPELEVDMHYGGQPIYYFIISLE